jgi:hypothetical protein
MEAFEMFGVFWLYYFEKSGYLALPAEVESELCFVTPNGSWVKAKFLQTLFHVRKQVEVGELELNLHVWTILTIDAAVSVE